jgi:hypothetical protein
MNTINTRKLASECAVSHDALMGELKAFLNEIEAPTETITWGRDNEGEFALLTENQATSLLLLSREQTREMIRFWIKLFRSLDAHLKATRRPSMMEKFAEITGCKFQIIGDRK